MEYLTKTKLSEAVGWSESGGRRWINFFQEYIPSVKRGNSISFTQQSVDALKELSNSVKYFQ